MSLTPPAPRKIPPPRRRNHPHPPGPPSDEQAAPPPQPRRSTTQRDRARAKYRRAQAACSICGESIDYALPHLHPREFVVDHVVPLHEGGRDDLTNMAPTHRSCNSAKGTRTEAPIVKRSGSLR